MVFRPFILFFYLFSLSFVSFDCYSKFDMLGNICKHQLHCLIFFSDCKWRLPSVWREIYPIFADVSKVRFIVRTLNPHFSLFSGGSFIYFFLLICHLPCSVNPDLSFLTISTRDHFKPPFFSITHLGFAACNEERHLCARCGGKDSKIGGTEGMQEF